MRLFRYLRSFALTLVCLTAAVAAEGYWNWQRPTFSPNDFNDRQACIAAFNGWFQPFEDSYAAESARLSGLITRFTAALSRLNADLFDARAAQTAAQNALDNEGPGLRQDINRLEALILQQQRNIDRLNAEIAALRARWEPNHHEANAALQVEIDRLMRELMAAVPEYHANLAALRAKQDRLRALEQAVQDRTRDVANIQQSIRGTESLIRLLQLELTEISERHDNMTSTWQSLVAACRDRE